MDEKSRKGCRSDLGSLGENMGSLTGDVGAPVAVNGGEAVKGAGSSGDEIVKRERDGMKGWVRLILG